MKNFKNVDEIEFKDNILTMKTNPEKFSEIAERKTIFLLYCAMKIDDTKTPTYKNIDIVEMFNNKEEAFDYAKNFLVDVGDESLVVWVDEVCEDIGTNTVYELSFKYFN